MSLSRASQSMKAPEGKTKVYVHNFEGERKFTGYIDAWVGQGDGDVIAIVVNLATLKFHEVCTELLEVMNHEQ